jgi:hypothetical protein
MVLRKMRWLCAAIVASLATVASPAVSKADTQILIQELDGSGNPVGGQLQITTGTSATFATTNFANISVSTTSGSGAIGSLTTSVSAGLSSTFNPEHTLKVVVTNDGFINPFPGEPAAITNTAGASSGIIGGVNIIAGTTQLLDVHLTNAANQAAILASGNVIAGPTGVAADTRPGGGGTTETHTSSTSLPSNYAIQQTIIVRATPTFGILTGSTVGGTVGSTVLTNAAPVPAPAGLVLALAAVPALGLRRMLRRKTA